MRLVIDGRPLVGERSGIGVHTAEIARRLDLGDPVVIASHAPIEIEPDSRIELDLRRSRPGVWWQQRHLPGVASDWGADVIWGPHGTLPLVSKVPGVVTVHDLTSIDMPGRHRLRTILSFNTLIGPSLSKARKVVAVSKDTATAVARRFGIDRGKLEVVYNGVDDFFEPGEPDVLPEKLLPGGYLLYVGTLEPRKGVGLLIDSWSAIDSAPPLVLCGAKGWKSDDVISRADADPRIIRTGWVTRGMLRDLYRGALATIYPSEYEGFGLPVLEAMRCGSPVITTSGGAIPEVAGDAALMIEPGDGNGLTEAIRTVMSDSGLRDELRSRGLEQARKFSWDRAASDFSAIFAEVAGAG